MTKVSRWSRRLSFVAALSLVATACGTTTRRRTVSGHDRSAGRRRRSSRHDRSCRDDRAAETTDRETTATPARHGRQRHRPRNGSGPAECPDGDSVPVAVPYEANQPAGENWRLGLEMAVAEINEAGGILGCQIVPEFQDTQADPDVSKQVVADMAEGDPYVFLGTVFSSNTIVNMVEAQRVRSPCSSVPRRRRSPTVRRTATTTSSIGPRSEWTPRPPSSSITSLVRA